MNGRYKPDAMDWTPEMMLESELEQIRAGHPVASKADKAIVIFLDDDGSAYNIRRSVSGMKGSETIALLEALKHIILMENHPPQS